MTVVRITIKKILTKSGYHYGRSAIVPFSTDMWCELTPQSPSRHICAGHRAGRKPPSSDERAF